MDFWTVWDTTCSPPGSDVVTQYSGSWTREAIEREVELDGYLVEPAPQEDTDPAAEIANNDRPAQPRF